MHPALFPGIRTAENPQVGPSADAAGGISEGVAMEVDAVTGLDQAEDLAGVEVRSLSEPRVGAAH